MKGRVRGLDFDDVAQFAKSLRKSPIRPLIDEIENADVRVSEARG